MNLKRLLYSKFSSIIISILLGLGFATMFRKECKDDSCFIYRAPPELSEKKNIYKYNNKCFKVKSKAGTCNSDKTTLLFA